MEVCVLVWQDPRHFQGLVYSGMSSSFAMEGDKWYLRSDLSSVIDIFCSMGLYKPVAFGDKADRLVPCLNGLVLSCSFEFTI
jgi:hypothetical protein